LKYLRLNRGAIVALLIISLIGFISFSWFRDNYLISAVDFTMPLDRTKSFVANLYLWDSESIGNANPRVSAFIFPVWTYFVFSEIMGLSVVAAEMVFFYLVFTLSGLSMYYLTITVITSKTFRYKELAGLISALFYMFNPYVATNIIPVRQVSYVVYSLFPLVFALFIKGLNGTRSAKSAMLVAFSFLLIASTFVDPSFVPLIFLPFVLYLIFFALTNPKKAVLFSVLKFTAVFVIVWALLNSYWIPPDAYSSSSELAKVVNAYNSIGSSFQSVVTLNSAPILGAMRLLGHWGLNASYKGDPYYLWASAYQTSLLLLISFLIPLLAFIPLLLRPKDRHVLFFASFAIASLFLVNGVYNPIGSLLYLKTPLFGVFLNTPYLRIGMYLTFAYAFLIGYAFVELFNRFTVFLKTRYSKQHSLACIPIFFMLFLIIGAYAFPLWTGDVIRSSTEVIKSDRYKLPAYYQTASDWLRTDNADFRIMVMPISKLGYAAFDWGNDGYNGPYPARQLFPKNIISSTLSGDGIVNLVAELIIDNLTLPASKILALMNVKYVLFHEDTNWLYIDDNPSWISASPQQLRSILNSSTTFSLEQTFGKLVFYRNNYWSPNHIYAATDSILIDVGLNKTAEIVERNDFKSTRSVLILSDQLENKQISDFPLNTIFVQNLKLLNSTDSPISNALNTARIIYAIDSQPTTIFTPNRGNYLLAIKVETGYGYGDFLTEIDDQIFTIDANSQEQGPVVTYKYVGPINLTAGYHIISTSGENTSIPVYDGLANPINWASTFASQSYAARYYPGWKAVVRTDVSEPWDALSFPAIDQSPYAFPQDFTSWNAYNSTLVYLVAEDSQIRIDEISTDGNPTSDITGVWWETDWMGMATKPVTFPIIIPPHQKAIIQINHKADAVTLKTNPPPIENMLLYSLKDGENFVDANNLLSSNQTTNPSVTYEKIDPTKYTVHVNTSAPFYLVFSETYDKDWIATIDGQQVPNEYHFTANGFANGWYINKTGTFTITLEFWPQNLFYAGSAISITTLILCTIYLSKDKIKIMFQRIARNKISRKD
jgi:hypothetical protein